MEVETAAGVGMGVAVVHCCASSIVFIGPRGQPSGLDKAQTFARRPLINWAAILSHALANARRQA